MGVGGRHELCLSPGRRVLSLQGMLSSQNMGLVWGQQGSEALLFAGSICLGCQPPGLSARGGQGGWVAFTRTFSLELPFKLLLAFDSNYIKKDH